MKKKGFTLVELLVVIAIIALLMGILMPALARVRAIAFRMVCGSNLSGIGKAMLIYANDYEDEFPKAGIKGVNPPLLILASGVGISDWTGGVTFDRAVAFANGNVTMTSCLYLLIKYAEVTPKSFVCKGDGATELKISEEVPPALPANLELIGAWDFGRTTADDSPTKHCSYSYHQPLPLTNLAYTFALTTSSDPGVAVAADRNPWTSKPVGGTWNWPATLPLVGFMPVPLGGTTEEGKQGNSVAHGKEGQNVLFLDSHVYFEKYSYCAVEDDNIYTSWTTASPPEKRKGVQPVTPFTTLRPRGKTDSLLVNNLAP